MNNKRLLGISLATLSLALSANPHIVKKGETLSGIIYQAFPGHRVFGREGLLASILTLNPWIKNANRIYPGQKVVLHETPQVQAVASSGEFETEDPPSKPEVPFPWEEKPFEIEIPYRSRWNLSALYGAKYLSVLQSGKLGSANVSVIFVNNVKLRSEFDYQNWIASFEFDTYRFKYKTMSSSDEKNMNSLNLNLSYNHLSAGIEMEQSPVFRNNNGQIEMMRQTVSSAKLGVRKKIDLIGNRPTSLTLGANLKYPFAASGDNADVKISSFSGLGADGSVELVRSLVERTNYQLRVSWVTDLNYQSYSQNTEWGNREGKVKLQYVSASSALGLQLSF